MTQTLHKILSDWDGKDTGFLERLFHDEAGNPDFLGSLVALAALEESQRGATWLLKHHFDARGAALPQDLTRNHLSQLIDIDDWQTRLHVLQYLEHLDLSEGSKTVLSEFVETSLRSDRTFVRAWAWYALAILVAGYPEERDDTLRRLREAQATETAGSAKVRIRKAIAKLQG